MARVRDLWLTADARKTRRHPDRGGNKNAKRWLACWDRADGSEGTRAFSKKIDASKYGSTMESEELRGIRRSDPKRGAMSVQEYGESEFMPAMLHLRTNSVSMYKSHLENHISRAWEEENINYHPVRRPVLYG